MVFLNNFINFSLKIKDRFALIEFVLEKDLEPGDLANISPPDPVKYGFSSKIIIISGRGPIWLYGYLVHYYHPVKAIALFDPRLDGAVVVESHTKEFKVGKLIKRENFL